MSLQHYLELCLHIEETIAEIYRELPRQVECDEELRKIWERMAKEEDSHAVAVKFAQRLAEEAIFSGFTLTDERVESLCEQVDQLYERVRSQDLDQEEALRLSMFLEQDFLDVHVNTAAHFKDEKMKQLFQSLAKADEVHVAGLKDYFRRHYRREPIVA